MKSKNQIANQKYDEDFEYLSGGEKAAVSRAYNAQKKSKVVRTIKSASAGVKASIGRVGNNGTKTCILNAGATVQDLLDQSGYSLDVDKERILDNDTGMPVDLNDVAKHNGTYAIAVEIKSA